jgi:UDP:flavonoid glycosyltransferase YjiC (YdhE family)
MRTLMHGLPLVVLPADPRIDQPSVGRAVQAAGAGLLLDTSSPPERIRRAVTAVLGEPAYRAAADAVGQRLRARDEAQAGADVLERIAGLA